MPDLKKLTLAKLRALARKLLGPGQSRKSKAELVADLEAKERPAAARDAGGRARSAGRPAAPEKAGKGARAGEKGEKVPRPARGAARGAARKSAEGARTPARASGARGGAARGAAGGAKRAKGSSPGGTRARAAAVAGAAAGAAADVAAARKAVRARKRAKPPVHAAEGPDPDGYFVARVRGEDALRDAPHPMAEATGEGWAGENAPGAAVYDEGLGDLPWGYGDDAFVALPRDPRTLFLYWDWSHDTLARVFEGLERPRTQLWIFSREGEGWDRVRILEFALESRGFYVHDLAPGRTYRAEIHVVDRAGRERLLAGPSNACALPAAGPSPVIDDRFVRIPWEVPLGQLLGPGHAGSPFGDDVRAQLARLSDWSRFSGGTWGGSAGGMGGRPSSPTTWPTPSSPSGGGR